MKTYRIVQLEYNEKYIVQIQKRFLFFKWWTMDKESSMLSRRTRYTNEWRYEEFINPEWAEQSLTDQIAIKKRMLLYKVVKNIYVD
jgi:hypothetical protein